MGRREFLGRSLVVASAGVIGATGSAYRAEAAEPGTRPATQVLRAAVIGHTGQGDYGHGMDVAYADLPGVEVVAVADPDLAGRTRAAKRAKAPRDYSDYREMLAKEKPDLVSVAPRWSVAHRDMALAAIGAGAHVYMEKPIAPSLAECDEILAAADRAGRKVAVAHQMRLSPSVVHLKKRIDAGLIGDLLQINAFGKQDARAGGEDLVVLGGHLFDLTRLFAGDALWCTARVMQGERDITRADARTVKDQVGPVAGDTIFAQFGLANGVNATFTSRAGLRERTGHWGIELVGSKTSARILADIWPSVQVMKPGKWEPTGRADAWEPLADDPGVTATVEERSVPAANRRVVDDWLAAIRENREPQCSGRNAMKAVEMVSAVFQAGVTGARAPLPLADRKHPLRPE